MQFGQVFNEKRESLGLTLGHIEEETKIRKLYLDAIEREDFDILPPRVYATGFVKKYARYLGLDEKALVQQFVDMAYGSEEKEEVQAETPKEPARPEFQFSGLNWRNVVVAGAFLLATWWVGGVVVDMVSQHGSNMVKSPPQQTTPAPLPEPTPVDKEAPEKIQLATVRISALSNCWVKAIVDGETVFSKTMTAGQEEVFEGREAVLLTVGNAGGIEVYYNGERIGPLGESGEVINKEFRVAHLSSQ